MLNERMPTNLFVKPAIAKKNNTLRSTLEILRSSEKKLYIELSFQTYTIIKNIKLFRTSIWQIQIDHHKLLRINKLQYFQFHTKKWRILIKTHIQREISLKKIRHKDFFHYAYFTIQVGIFCFKAYTQL